MGKYRVHVFFEDKSFLELIKKILAKRSRFELCGCRCLSGPPEAVLKPCDCSGKERCVDIIILRRHAGNLRALEVLRQQAANQCKVPWDNKLVISSIYDDAGEIDQIKGLGATVMEMPVSIKAIDGWLDRCEERLKGLDKA